MLNFFLDNFSAQWKCEKVVEKLLLKIINVPDQHTPQQMYEKIILDNSGMLQFIPNCCKTQKMYKKGVDHCSHVLEFAPDCYMTKEMCEKVLIGTYPSNIIHIFNCYKT